jgi:CHAT domain-containing protein/tetratricopeptide (TPR) repeat protein
MSVSSHEGESLVVKARNGRLGWRALGWLVAASIAIVAGSPATAAAPRPASHRPAATRGPRAAPGKAASGAEQAELAQLDKDITAAQVKQANFAAAKLARRALALQIQLTGPDSAEAQRRKQTLAGMLGLTGDYRGQLALDQELLAAAEHQHGPESREALTALAFLTGPYWAASRYDELETVIQRQLALTRKLDGEASTAYASLLSQYGTLLTQRNEYASAQQVYEQSLKIQEGLSKDPSQLLGAIETLANAYWQANQRARAVALFDRALAMTDQPGMSIMLRGSTLWMIVSLYHYGGRDDLARPLVKKAIELYEGEIARLERDKPDDYTLPGLIGQLGFTYRQSGELARAEQTFEKVIALDRKRGGFSAWASTLAEVKRAQGKPREALALLDGAQAALAKLSPQSAGAFNAIIADVAREVGDYARAERLLAEYRASLEKTYGRRHPLYGMAELSTAYVYMASGRPALAEQLLADGLEIAERDLQLVLRTGTEADHAVYFAKNGYQLDTAINFELNYAPRSASAARLGLTTLLRRKGRVLDAAASSLTTLRARVSPDDKQLLDDLASARAQLARLTVAGPSATGDDDFTKEIAALEDQIQKLEIQLGKKSAAYRAASQPIVLAAVQKAIARDARLVEIVNFQPWDPRQPYSANQVLGPRRYAAFVAARTGDPVLIDLGPAAAIDDAVEQFRKAVSDPDNDRAPELGHALYALTLAKIAPALGGATRVLIAPDGALNVVPFSALVDDRGEFLIKRYTFTYLTSGRDLLRLGIKTRPQGSGAMFADPRFDAAAPAPAPSGAVASTRGRRAADLGLQHWKPLPGTAQEADAVEQHLRGLVDYRGERATETALKAVHGPKVLHLATHGFFLPDAAAPAGAGAGPDPGGGAPAAAGGPTVGSEARENPLLRSGLALAGANQLVSGADDGILTAMEAAGLDLWGTQLVVLSACETGVGKVTNGDGVYGLRRALVIAGAESLVMSLWQVDDAATRDLMAGYYGRLAAGKPRSSALRDVQLEIQGKPKYGHPYYWASFLPAGDDTPLGR